MKRSQWRQVVNDDDAEELLSTFGAFHDSVIRELYFWTGQFVDDHAVHCDPETFARMLFQRGWPNPRAIELLFGEVIVCTIVPTPRGYDPMMSAGWITPTEQGWMWSEFEPAVPQEGSWVSAKSLWWRPVDWMGSELRYGSMNDLPDLNLREGWPHCI